MGANFSGVRSAAAAQAPNSAWDTVVNNAVQSVASQSGQASGGPASSAPASPIGAGGVPSPIAAAVAPLQAANNQAKRSLLG